ncbi:MAG: HAD family phosphatase [Flavobacteriales bacterium]|nr:HAD family phosphatase [Flavobacteriales bacterium]
MLHSNIQHLKGQVDAIIFDFGGVLFDIDYDAPVRAFRELGLKNFDEIYAQASQSTLFDDLETGKIGASEFVAAIRAHFESNLSDEDILYAWNVILLGIPRERAELVHLIKSRYRTFILSNTNAIHVEVFEQMIDETIGLDWFKSAFEKVMYSNEIGIKKPYPKTYLQVCEWNDLDPSRTLFIDDSIQHAEGAAKAGLHAYHLDLSRENILDVLEDWAT